MLFQSTGKSLSNKHPILFEFGGVVLQFVRNKRQYSACVSALLSAAQVDHSIGLKFDGIMFDAAFPAIGTNHIDHEFRY